MTVGQETFSKVLKDETRRKIILLLKDNDSLAYTDLMNGIGIANTGRLNYHLKILDDLLIKNEKGQYQLSERGKIASNLLIGTFEQDNTLKAKKEWWRRFWVVTVLLQVTGVLLIMLLASLGYLSIVTTAQSLFGFSVSMVLLYFLYKMLRPVNDKTVKQEQTRTIRDILVSGKEIDDIKIEVYRWIDQENITIDTEKEGFVRGYLGSPSGMGFTAPIYFQVTFKSDGKNVIVHTEGWISAFGVSERGFSTRVLTYGGLPRRKGWVVLSKLWRKLAIL